MEIHIVFPYQHTNSYIKIHAVIYNDPYFLRLAFNRGMGMASTNSCIEFLDLLAEIFLLKELIVNVDHSDPMLSTGTAGGLELNSCGTST